MSARLVVNAAWPNGGKASVALQEGADSEEAAHEAKVYLDRGATTVVIQKVPTAPAVAPAPTDAAPAPVVGGAGAATEQETTRSERNSDRAEGAPAAPGTDGSA